MYGGRLSLRSGSGWLKNKTFKEKRLLCQKQVKKNKKNSFQ